ncbi:MAG TPA: hypothetical protein VK602_16075 [Phyllobacterium sp.]|nr:hypothetical protein [Phyllobacterium sp.]
MSGDLKRAAIDLKRDAGELQANLLTGSPLNHASMPSTIWP